MTTLENTQEFLAFVEENSLELNVNKHLGFLDDLKDLTKTQLLCLDYYINYKGVKNFDLEGAIAWARDSALVFEGSSEDYAYELVSDCYNIDEMMGSLSYYFDYEKFGRDLELGGDIIKLDYDVYLTNPHGL